MPNLPIRLLEETNEVGDNDEFVIQKEGETTAKKVKGSNLPSADVSLKLDKDFSGFDAKNSPVNADIFVLNDSEDSGIEKKTTWENIKNTLKTFFDGIYTTLTAFNDHSARHENGGDDEINIAGLSGELSDPQTPKEHGNEAHIPHFLPSSNFVPAGSDKQIQFNDGGAFGGDADFAWDKVSKVLNLIGRLLVNKASYPEIDLFDGDFSGDGAGGTNDGIEIAIDTSNGWGLGAGALVLVSYYKNIGFINLDGDAGVLFDFKDGAGIGSLDFSDLTANRIFTFPNLAGTIALTSDLDDYIPYNDADQDILPLDDTVSLGSLISEKRFKHIHISGVKVESEFTSSGEAQVFGFTLSAVIGQTIGVTDQESNGVLTFGRTTPGNVGHTGSRVWLPTLNPVFYSIQKFNSITDNQHIWGLMTIGTDISDIEGIYFAKLTGEANIQARVRDGSGTQTVDTGVAVVDATMQEFLIEVSSGRAIFYINGTEVADISSNVPTEHLRWVWRIETSGAGTKTFGLDYAKIYQNRT